MLLGKDLGVVLFYYLTTLYLTGKCAKVFFRVAVQFAVCQLCKRVAISLHFHKHLNTPAPW